MSTTTVAGGATPSSGNHSGYLTNIGLGYAIAIALGFLVLLSTILLASYVCCRNRSRHRHRHRHSRNPNPTSSDGVVLPRIIFVAEDEDSAGANESGAVGLDPAVINSYPRFPFCKSGSGFSDNLCSICLCEYRDSEMLRMMPDCRHFFHLLCLDAWLKLNGTCPVCRNSPLPTPISTPLAEVVPLAQYPR